MLLADIDILFNDYYQFIDKLYRYVAYHMTNFNDKPHIIHSIINEKNRITYQVFKELITKAKLSKTNIKNICNYIYKTQNTKMLLRNITKDPYYFVYTPTNPLINFKKAEFIETLFNCDYESKSKDKAWIYDYILRNNENKSFYVTKHTIFKDYHEYFNKNINVNVLDKLCVKQVFDNDDYYTAKRFYNIEKFIAGTINSINFNNDKYEWEITDTLICKYEYDHNITLNTEQRDCVHNMLQHNLCLVSGYPGVGKTTIVDVYCHCILNISKPHRICIVAPTGMAVKNIQSKISNYCTFCTIHKLIHNFDYETNLFEDMPIRTLIVDETSMVDSLMMYNLLKIINSSTCNVIFLGDTNQLPPIGIGEPFKYFILSNAITHITLSIIKRQENCQLKDVIKTIIEKPFSVRIDNFDNKSLFFIETKSFNYNFFDNFIKEHNLDIYNTKFISPCHGHDSGVKNLNLVLKSIYNPKFVDDKIFTSITRNRYSKDFMVDDLLLLTKNLPNNNYVNGDFFTLTNIDRLKNNEYTRYSLKRFNDADASTNIVSADDMFDMYELGYVCTIHKVQGSQYDNVVIIMDDKHRFQWSKDDAINLLYTAISRAKQRCFIVGDKKQFYNALRSKPSATTHLTNIISLIK